MLAMAESSRPPGGIRLSAPGCTPRSAEKDSDSRRSRDIADETMRLRALRMEVDAPATGRALQARRHLEVPGEMRVRRLRHEVDALDGCGERPGRGRPDRPGVRK